MTRPTNADLERFLAACSSREGQPPEPFDLATCYEIAHELLAKRRELRVARALITTANLWPRYEAELKAARRRRKE